MNFPPRFAGLRDGRRRGIDFKLGVILPDALGAEAVTEFGFRVGRDVGLQLLPLPPFVANILAPRRKSAASR